MTDKLRCPNPACANREEFASGRTYFATTTLDGDGHVYDKKTHDYSDEGFDVTCTRCGAVVVAGEPEVAAAPEPAEAGTEAVPYERWILAVYGGLAPAASVGAGEAEREILAMLAPEGEDAGGLPAYLMGGTGTLWEEEHRARKLLGAMYGPVTEHPVYVDIEGALATVLVVDTKAASVADGRPGELRRRVCVDLVGLAVGDAPELRRLYEDVTRYRDVGDVACLA